MIYFRFIATMRLVLIILTLSVLLLFIKTAHGYKASRLVKKRRIPNFYADFVAISDVSKRDSIKKVKDSKDSKDAKDSKYSSKGETCKTSSEYVKTSESSKAKCPGVDIKMNDPKQKASSIAVKAAEDAKAAQEAQSSAGQAAAQKIKLELAEKAMLAAKAAEAALASKQVIVDNLKQEVKEAESVVEEETLNLNASDENMNIAIKAASNAKAEVKAIAAIVETARQNKAITEQLATAAQQEMEKKNQLVDAAKSRLACLHKQLEAARSDFEKTKAAAYNAACAALEAKQKATDRADRSKRNKTLQFYRL